MLKKNLFKKVISAALVICLCCSSAAYVCLASNFKKNCPNGQDQSSDKKTQADKENFDIEKICNLIMETAGKYLNSEVKNNGDDADRDNEEDNNYFFDGPEEDEEDEVDSNHAKLRD